MRSVVVIFALAVTLAIGLFGFSGIVGPVAKVAILLIPAVFTVSLIIGFASRRQTWFR